MRLKDLLTCTIGIFLCTSCIKDETPNAEADIEKCILPADILSGTEIDYNLPFDESLNAYPIYIEVNNGTDLTAQAPTFELTPEQLLIRPVERRTTLQNQCAIPPLRKTENGIVLMPSVFIIRQQQISRLLSILRQ